MHGNGQKKRLFNSTNNELQIEMSLPNSPGILTSIEGTDKGEQVSMLVMPVMLNS